ncbi:porin [Caballeronia sp. LP006]|nr:porin [Caballeronia sp. LP006]MDR5830197.1 porin [Caballeronia sp. LP006]
MFLGGLCKKLRHTLWAAEYRCEAFSGASIPDVPRRGLKQLIESRDSIKGIRMKKNLIGAAVAALAASFATAASAQSSVTLYGTLDAGFTFVNNVRSAPGSDYNKASAWGVTGNNVQDSRWGLTGAEDLGNGMKAVFRLESGFNPANGSGAGAARQSYVGISTNQGTVTLGRQNDAVADYLGPLSATGTFGGTYFAHPDNLDNLDGNNFRLSNSVKFQSANYAGLTFGGEYGFSNSAGSFAANRAYSLGAGYANGPIKAGIAYTQANGINSNNAGAINGATVVPHVVGDAFVAAGQPAEAAEAAFGTIRQRTFGAGASYSTNAMQFGLLWTQVRQDGSNFDATAVTNNYEANARYALTPALSLGAAYTFTNQKLGAAGESTRVRYHQFGLQTDYALSKRTDVYAEGVMQIASGLPENEYPSAQISGAAASSSSRQVLVTAGIRHRF